MAESDIQTTSRESEPPRGTSVRPLARLLAGAAPLWIFDHDGRLAYVSAECGRWLGIDPQHLIGRDARAIASSEGTAADFAARVATSIAPPAGVGRGALVAVTVHPPAASAELDPPTPRSVLYVPLGSDALPAIMAIADVAFPERVPNETLESRVLLEEVARQMASSPVRAPLAITLGSSVAAQRLNYQIAAACSSFTHVTLICPAGSPAEPIVRHIHDSTPALSGDASAPPGPLVPVDGPLMDAELFDVTTGALVSQLVEGDASTAALLVHHIDQMPGDAQSRLALLLHNHPHRLRLFATTTRHAAKASLSLLPSLAALIGTFELHVPPLRERVEDIPQIAAALLERRRLAGETRAEQIGRDALDRLVLYPWPANFEELVAAISSASRECRGETIRIEHLPLVIRSFGAPQASTPRPPETKFKAVALDEALERLECELIRRALEHSRGNRAAAARQLGISRPRLLRRIDQLGVDALKAESADAERPAP